MQTTNLITRYDGSDEDVENSYNLSYNDDENDDDDDKQPLLVNSSKGRKSIRGGSYNSHDDKSPLLNKRRTTDADRTDDIDSRNLNRSNNKTGATRASLVIPQSEAATLPHLNPNWERHFENRGIKDKCNLVYIIFHLLGIGLLLPWNFFSNAGMYFSYKLRNTTLNSTNWDDPENSTYDQDLFINYLGLAALLPNVLFMLLNIAITNLIPSHIRIYVSYVVICLMFLFTVSLTCIDTDTWQKPFLYMTLTSIILMNGFCAILQGGIIGLMGKFPFQYSSALMGGMAMGGLFSTVIFIVVISVEVEPLLSGFIYFSIAFAITFICVLCYHFMFKNRFANHYLDTNTSVLTSSRFAFPNRNSRHSNIQSDDINSNESRNDDDDDDIIHNNNNNNIHNNDDNNNNTDDNNDNSFDNRCGHVHGNIINVINISDNNVEGTINIRNNNDNNDDDDDVIRNNYDRNDNNNDDDNNDGYDDDDDDDDDCQMNYGNMRNSNINNNITNNINNNNDNNINNNNNIINNNTNNNNNENTNNNINNNITNNNNINNNNNDNNINNNNNDNNNISNNISSNNNDDDNINNNNKKTTNPSPHPKFPQPHNPWKQSQGSRASSTSRTNTPAMNLVQYLTKRTQSSATAARYSGVMASVEIPTIAVFEKDIATTTRIMDVMKEVKMYALTICFTFLVTLSVFPAITSSIQSQSKDNDLWSKTYFTPVVCFLIFNLADLIGRIFAGITKWPSDQYHIWIISLSRILFVPLFFYSNAGPRRFTDPVIKSDLVVGILNFLFGTTNGYAATLAMMFAPRVISNEQNIEMAGSIMSFSFALGLGLGSLLSMLLRFLL